VVQGARDGRRDKIIGVDLNPGRKALAEKFRLDALRQSRKKSARIWWPTWWRSPDGGAD